MLKHKKFFSLLLLLPVFSVFSCAKPKEPYDIVKNDTKLEVTITKKKYENGQKLVIDSVSYDGGDITKWVGKDYKDATGYFICTSADYPTNTIVAELTMTTNVEENSLKFYVGHFVSEDKTIHLSKEQKVTIVNDGAIKPWVWYVVTAVVVFGVIGMVLFTRHYKSKKAEKI